LLAVAGLERLRAGQTDAAGEQAKNARSLYDPIPGQARPPLSPSLVALCMALGSKAPDPEGEATDDPLNHQIGTARGFVLKGNLDQARDLAAKIEEPEPRWRVLVAIAATMDKPDADVLGKALSLVEDELKERTLSPWVVLRMFELCASAGIAEDRLQKAANSLADTALAGRAMLAVLRAKLERTKDNADLAWADMVNKNSPAHATAILEVARHNAKRKALTAQEVNAWDNQAKVFGYMGLALGRKDAE
jgi:hypothetical protein